MKTVYTPESIFNPFRVPFRRRYISANTEGNIHVLKFVSSEQEVNDVCRTLLMEIFEETLMHLTHPTPFELKLLNKLFAIVEGESLRLTVKKRGTKSNAVWGKIVGEAIEQNISSGSTERLGYDDKELFIPVSAFELLIQVCEVFPQVGLSFIFTGFDEDNNSVDETVIAVTEVKKDNSFLNRLNQVIQENDSVVVVSE